MAPSGMARSAGGEAASEAGLSKWQYALIFATPVAAGLAYWYYKKARGRAKPPGAGAGETKVSKSADKSQTNHSRGAADAKDPFERAKAFKNQGNKYFKEGKFDKAIECYTEAIALCPPQNKNELATFYQNRAAAYENLKNYTAVIADCTRAIDLNFQYVKALHRRAKAYEVVDELDKCLEDITAVCILEGFQNQNSLLVTDRVLKKIGKARAKELIKARKPIMPSKHFIRNYFVSFCEDPVIKAVQAFREGKPFPKSDSPGGAYAQAVECLANEKYEDVIAHCTKEIENSGDAQAEALLLRGTLYMLQGLSQATVDDLNRVLQMDMDTAGLKVRVNALIKLGTLKVHAEKLEEALEDFEQAATLDPSNADVFLHRGQVLLLLDRLEDTLKDMERSVTLRPDFPSAAAQRCYVLYRCGGASKDPHKQMQAFQQFEDIQERFPKCPECYFLHAQILSENKEFEKAEENFLKAQKADPTDPNVPVHLGILHLQWTQDFEKAAEFMYKAIEMDDKCQFAYETLGSVQVQRGFLKEGLELFDKAIVLAQTEAELAHLLSLRDAAAAQGRVASRLGMAVTPGFS
ncbi:mitochondrial import receptor subunit TOM70 isoform X4 [Dermacentor silvarum]|uniref:mitochondrial import receptor subunit TOM70 isoform X1 n=1 Tax=Dermacentor silvarum TaxID=543639 RepID=UPI002100717A|nr:mitochondrial import receptor subunit TOM70 isoform X1 [Dermacentor silvarum]XP_049524793.1 mitochondrial import receptor subunit TOM70 isoform X2 [Dermacentor silvarum]XP_049524794.1 mitochondrial import receptor subunit TOM70 isoform X3 [Dermacentor silvarum]XP_049524795.1 mitochondrial import receptor subunit TOM70 isoform X4 [Dermacentor silvarum]